MHTKMGKDSIGPLILKLAIPAMISMLISAMYSIVDMYFVSQINENAVTGVLLAMPFVNIVIGVGVGTGVGLNSLVSRRMGEGKHHEANRAAEHSIPFGILWGIAFAIFAFIFIKPIFTVLGKGNEEVIRYATQYATIYLAGSFTILIQLHNEKIIQGTGNTLYPMLFGILGTIINIILDPILIHGLFGFPRLEVVGAAVATIIGQGSAMVASIIALYSRRVGFKIRLRSFKPNMQTIKDVYAVGFPSIVMQTIGALTTILINGILRGFTDTAVNVLGFYFQLQNFIFMPVFGLTQGALPVMGYNYGAKLKDRLQSALIHTNIYALVLMFLGTVLLWVFPESLLSIFLTANENPQYVQEILEIGSYALRVISTSFMLAGVNIVFSNYFQATGNGTLSMIISLLRQVFIILPVAFVMSRVVGLPGVWFSYPIAEVIACVATLSVFFFSFRHKIEKYMNTSFDTEISDPAIEELIEEIEI